MKNIHPVICNLLLALLITLAFFALHWVAVPSSFSFSFLLHRNNFLIVFLIILAGTFIKTNGGKIAFFSFLLFMILIEMLHIAYYGNTIFAIEFYIFFTHFNEVSQGIVQGEAYRLFVVPLICASIVKAGYIFLQKKFGQQLYSVKYAGMIIFILLLAFPVKLYLTGDKLGLRAPIDQHILRSGIEGLSSFLGRILPEKISGDKKDGKEKAIPAPPVLSRPDVNIIFVLGESLGVKHMSAFGYPVSTTPRIKKLVEDGELIPKVSIPYGICTDVTLPGLFNMLEGMGGMEQVISQHTALFRMAKMNGFSTYFISAQSEKNLGHFFNYIGSRHIDVYKSAQHIHSSAGENDNLWDEVLADELKKIPLSKGKNFIVLQQYGSHEAYSERVPQNETQFVAKDNSFHTRQSTAYDNSVHYTDKVLAEIIEHLEKNSSVPTYFIFTADHGEVVGESGRYGHCMFDEQVVKVPFLFTAFHTDTLMENKVREMPFLICHKNVAQLLANLMGYDVKIIPQEQWFVNGMEPDGSSGFLEITYNDSVFTGFRVH